MSDVGTSVGPVSPRGLRPMSGLVGTPVLRAPAPRIRAGRAGVLVILLCAVAAGACAASPEKTAVATLREAVDAARAGDDARAADLARRARTERPGFVDPLFVLARLDEKRGDYDSARRAYREILADDPTSTAAAVALANTFLSQRRFDEAEDWLRRALEEDPGAEAAAFNLGSLSEQRGDLDAAARWFELSAALDRRDPRSPTRVARIRLNQGRTDRKSVV